MPETLLFFTDMSSSIPFNQVFYITHIHNGFMIPISDNIYHCLGYLFYRVGETGYPRKEPMIFPPPLQPFLPLYRFNSCRTKSKCRFKGIGHQITLCFSLCLRLKLTRFITRSGSTQIDKNKLRVSSYRLCKMHCNLV